MLKNTEPDFKKSSCSYCGDAPINHTLFYLESIISSASDAHIQKVVSQAPLFLKNFADFILVFGFKTLLFLKFAHFSSDIDKANTFRSRVIWAEAKRRGIIMEQLVIFGKTLDHYRATLPGGSIYFESIPIPPRFLDMKKNWDDKVVLKEELEKGGVPVPSYFQLPFFHLPLEQIFSELKKPVIVKPKVGSRGRHTVTNIHTLAEFRRAVQVARQISMSLVVEEHLSGSVCRATLVQGTLAGFYRGNAPKVVGDGKQTVRELIHEKNRKRPERVQAINISRELLDHIARSGFSIDEVLPLGVHLSLSHRMGRLFGGRTKEMIDDLHPSFVPIFEKAARITGLAVVGFDCIVPDPTASADSQKWGIIECNTLPFIDLHYYALEGKPKNIAGMIWDMWQ